MSWSESLFWAIAALLAIAALAFVLPPLLRRRSPPTRADRRDINIAVYRDQLREMEADLARGLLSEAQFLAGRREIEAGLAEDALAQAAEPAPPASLNRAPGLVLGAVLPIAAFGLYFAMGNPDALKPPPPAQPGMMEGHDVERLIRQLEAKVQANPQDADGWAMLARSYAALDRWPEAWKSYQFAVELRPQDAALLAGQAEALAVLKGGNLQGEPLRMVQRALELDPNEPKALELSAAHAFQQRDFPRAAETLERLLRQLSPDDPFARQIQTTLDQVRQIAAGGAPAAAAPPRVQGQAAPPAGPTIRGSIDVSPALRQRIDPQDVIFLFARPTAGGPPVAAVRGPAASFPMDFELSDRWAMNPDNPLSRHKQVMLVARISKGGGAMAQSGDLEGSVSGVEVGAQGIKLVIDRVVP